MQTQQQADKEARYRFTGNSFGLHTRISIYVHRIEFLTSTARPVRVFASIGESEDDSLPTITFDLTYREALTADIIESVG